MYRRDFLRLLGLGALGLLWPEQATERIDMPIGDILKRVALGQTVSTGDAEQLRLWGNKVELQSAFVGGLQTGQSDVNANKVYAQSAEFQIQPFHLGGIYSTSLDAGDFLELDTTYSAMSPGSHFILDPDDNTKINLALPIANLETRKYLLTGTSVKSDSTTNMGIRIQFYTSGDALVDAQELFLSEDVLENFSYTFPSVDTVITDVAYIKFYIGTGSAVFLGSEMYFNLAR